MEKLKALFQRGSVNKLAAGAAVGSTAFVATSASAFAIDVSSVTTVLTDVGTAIGVIGLAVLAVVYGAKAYKWIRSAG